MLLLLLDTARQLCLDGRRSFAVRSDDQQESGK
jgi:hypothetical protein